MTAGWNDEVRLIARHGTADVVRYRAGRLTVVVGDRAASTMTHDRAWRMVTNWYRDDRNAKGATA